MNNVHDVEQGSAQWKQMRLGMITASRFSDLMTNARGKDAGPGKTYYTYMYDLIAEQLTGYPQDEIVNNRAIQWGNENEPQARAMYCLEHNVRVTKVGFVTHPTIEGVGGSPDLLVEGDPDGPGGGELKCPERSRIHLQYLEGGIVPKIYYEQVQGLMWVTGRTWWDFISFDPRMPDHLKLFIVREQADLDFHADLEDRAKRFLEQMDIKLKKIKGEL